MICGFHRKLNMLELIDQPVRLIHYLYYTAIIESATDEGKKSLEAQAMEEALEV
jgi:hypothetical protein